MALRAARTMKRGALNRNNFLKGTNKFLERNLGFRQWFRSWTPNRPSAGTEEHWNFSSYRQQNRNRRRPGLRQPPQRSAAQEKCGAPQPERTALSAAHHAERQPHTTTHQAGRELPHPAKRNSNHPPEFHGLAQCTRPHEIRNRGDLATKMAGPIALKERHHCSKARRSQSFLPPTNSP